MSVMKNLCAFEESSSSELDVWDYSEDGHLIKTGAPAVVKIRVIVAYKILIETGAPELI